MTARLYVGAGCEAAEYKAKGWLCNDVASAAAIWPGIDYVGPCWSLPQIAESSIDEILAKGMFEHLTYHEAADSLAEWHRILVPGGHVTIEVPDVEEYIREYAKMLSESGPHGEGADGGAAGEPDDMVVCSGTRRWLRRALWGWQRWEGDEHRSGWDERLFAHYLRRAFPRVEIRRMAYNFEEDAPVSRTRHLWGRAWKA